MAALIAMQQNDIKRILAYSTLSQLGYMVMAVGLLRAKRRCFTFSRTPFSRRCSSSARVRSSHAAPRAEHLENGRACRQTADHVCHFPVGTLALIGCPPFSGFFSKDAILALAYERTQRFSRSLFSPHS